HMAVHLQYLRQGRGRVCIVVHDEYRIGAISVFLRMTVRRGLLRSPVIGDRSRHPDRERASFPEARALRMDRAAVQDGDALGDRQAETETAGRAVQALPSLHE